MGPDDLVIKIEQLREATDWKVPIHVKLGACRVDDDVKLAEGVERRLDDALAALGRLDDPDQVPLREFLNG